MIEGDNLEVLKLLQKSYAGKVIMIYIDPTYNTGIDFIYTDNFRNNIRNYMELTGQVDGEGRRTSSNTEASGQFHTEWLNMMYPRLKLTHYLLKLDHSNIRSWQPDRDDLEKTLLDYNEHIIEGRSKSDLLFELLLKLGLELELTIAIEEKTIANKTVFSIGAGVLMVCLANLFSSTVVLPMTYTKPF